MNTKYENPFLILKGDSGDQLEPRKVRWTSPSNIAIVKYWGKYGRQLPSNPSLSFTLSSAYTETTVYYSRKEDTVHQNEIELNFFFEGKENEAFARRISSFLQGLLPIFPFLGQLVLNINSENSFPHSSGIASSASSMSALALCLCSIERELFGTLLDNNEFMRKASYIARLGSGSACRSICAKIGIWGELEKLADSSDLFAVSHTENIHQDFLTFHDDILIISGDKKHVSSSAGHALMNNNVYAQARFAQAKGRVEELLTVLNTGDLDRFGEICESEALTLHALMMASHPPYLLLKPNTLHVINMVWDFRKRNGVPLYFSLDAGPNLHLLYPDRFKGQVQRFIDSDLKVYCEEGRVLQDVVGPGPIQLD